MLLAVDKEKWITSFDIIRKLKPHFPRKTKIWHSGTLDPMATWLMLIWIYKEWTKMLHDLQWLSKTYETTIDFSKMSDTRDMDYRDFYEEYEVSTKNTKKSLFIKDKYIEEPNIEEIKKHLDKLIPEYEIPLTPFSAKKINWQKMYDLARKWEAIIRNKIMTVHGYEIISYNFPELKIKFDVWSGTYIRSLWYRLWQQLWLGWILTTLRRLTIWEYDLKETKQDDELNLKYKTIIE